MKKYDNSVSSPETSYTRVTAAEGSSHTPVDFHTSARHEGEDQDIIFVKKEISDVKTETNEEDSPSQKRTCEIARSEPTASTSITIDKAAKRIKTASATLHAYQTAPIAPGDGVTRASTPAQQRMSATQLKNRRSRISEVRHQRLHCRTD